MAYFNNKTIFGMSGSRFKKETKGLFVVFVIAMLIRTFLYQPFNIPSGSMIPTLLVGDYLFVNKFCYGYSRYSFPLRAKLFAGRLMAAEPKRGDVIVFFNPKHDNLDYIKRLVGLPGDTIQVKHGILHINGKAVKVERVQDHHITDSSGNLESTPQYRETLPDGKSYLTLKKYTHGQGRLDNTEEFVVPAGHYFVMGDNRDNSSDSRVMASVGFVPFENLIGRAEVLFYSTAAKWYNPFQWFTELRCSRLGQAIN